MKKRVIYRPSGKAAEYSHLICNLYVGCTHGCKYCYGPRSLYKKREDWGNPYTRKDIIQNFRKEAAELKEQRSTEEILFCFYSDPYMKDGIDTQITREALEIIGEYGLRAQVLTKGGMLAARDFDLMQKYGVKFGTTLVFDNDTDRQEWEPGAASTSDRIEAIRMAHDLDIYTWVSCEPVIYPEQTLNIIEQLQDVVDEWKVGKLNHMKEYERRVDWRSFAESVLDLFERLRIPKDRYMLKKDLIQFLGKPIDDVSEVSLVSTKSNSHTHESGLSEKKLSNGLNYQVRAGNNVVEITDNYPILCDEPDVAQYNWIQEDPDIHVGWGRNRQKEAVIISRDLGLYSCFKKQSFQSAVSIFTGDYVSSFGSGFGKTDITAADKYRGLLEERACLYFRDSPEQCINYLLFLSDKGLHSSDTTNQPGGVVNLTKGFEARHLKRHPEHKTTIADISAAECAYLPDDDEYGQRRLLYLKSSVLRFCFVADGGALDHVEGILSKYRDDPGERYSMMVYWSVRLACGIFLRKPGLFRRYVTGYGRFIRSNIEAFEEYGGKPFREFWNGFNSKL